MLMEYLSLTGVVQTTKVEEPAPETGLGFFDSSQPYRQSLSLPRSRPRFPSASTRHLPAKSANKIAGSFRPCGFN